MNGINPATEMLVRKTDSIFKLNAEEHNALAALPVQVSELRADQDIVREGDRPSRSCFILEGFACAFKVTGDGRRQILAFQLPGDMPDLYSLHLSVLDSSIATLTPCKVGFVTHDALRELCERHPRLASAFWRTTLIDASIFREWMVNVGQRQASQRVAHLFCEMFVRSSAVGLTQGDTCAMFVTQSELADATGISTVHINRTIQALRRSGLIELKGPTLRILDWQRLEYEGDFDPTYLHLENSARHPM
jgi:CRP-like cAMP-binding protein